ncbi:hydroxyacid dehydrogenase [Cupriavidus sp. UYMMa02A]|nr:hydroxyacid dehydrogenase [Cupriavidus sp. UYMMa02A]
MTVKHKLLQSARLPAALESRLAQAYDVHLLWAESDPLRFLEAQGHGFDTLVTTATVGASKDLICALPALRVISSFGVGLDKLDLETARRRGVAVGYTPDVLNECVADTAFALLMDVVRRVSEADRFVRRGEWRNGPFPLSTRVSGKRIGIVGMGRIGRVIAKRSLGFTMPVRYYSRRPALDVPYERMASLVALAEWADFLVVATAGGPEARHLINAGVLDALGQRGYLINIARGTVIDEVALVDALVSGRIAGAGLDVYENEPQVPEALLGLDNVVLLPHVASSTEETRKAMGDLVLDNLQSFFSRGYVQASALE